MAEVNVNLCSSGVPIYLFIQPLTESLLHGKPEGIRAERGSKLGQVLALLEAETFDFKIPLTAIGSLCGACSVSVEGCSDRFWQGYVDTR